MLRQALVSRDQISDEDIRVFFAISKMTVVDEMTERQKYFSLEFVEFEEFLCRVASFVFGGRTVSAVVSAALSARDSKADSAGSHIPLSQQN
jgi:hypothetical protein